MSNKIAVVFGGSRGIGAETVKALNAAGYSVALTYVSRPPAEMPAAPGTAIKAYACEICDPDAVAQLFEAVKADFGAAPDCVVANAGINVPAGPLAKFDPDSFRRLVEVNLVGAFNVLAEAARQVADGGSIIAVTTSLVRFALPGTGPYSATKAAVECLARSLQKELAGRGVRVNCVAPGPTDTDLFRAGKDEATIRRMAAMSPLDRIGRPEESAAVIAFLATEKASWVAGQVVQTNGGMV